MDTRIVFIPCTKCGGTPDRGFGDVMKMQGHQLATNDPSDEALCWECRKQLIIAARVAALLIGKNS